MEGPSLYLTAEQLRPFVHQELIQVSGNSKIGIERLHNQKINDIFSWGKHLVFQFDTFALRVHFMLFGSFEATVAGKPVTGDYKKNNRVPRLKFELSNGHIEMYSCSLKYLELSNAKASYDFCVDVMSEEWDSKRALKTVLSFPDEQIADVLLNQEIFAGVGNIIKNEILFMARIHPEASVSSIKTAKIKKLIKLAQTFSFQFYAWRKQFVLRKNLIIYQKSVCPSCAGKVVRRLTGKRRRWSSYCPHCQKP